MNFTSNHVTLRSVITTGNEYVIKVTDSGTEVHMRHAQAVDYLTLYYHIGEAEADHKKNRTL